MIRTAFARAFALLGLAAGTLLAAGAASAETLVVYSARNEQLIKPVFDAYTGDRCRGQVHDGRCSRADRRLAAEGRNSPADILMTVDAGELWNAAERGLLRPVQSQVLARNIPSHLRDPQNRWFGLSQRARTIVYSPARVDAKRLSTYEALAAPEWKGRLCLRTSKKVYNQSLVATMIAAQGEKKTEQIVRGWVTNLATDVFANDTQLLEAIAAGQCDVGIVNTYYYGRIVKERPGLPGGRCSGQPGCRRHAREHLGCGRHSALAQRRRGHALPRVAVVRHGAGALRGGEHGVPGQPGGGHRPDRRVVGKFKASPINVAEAADCRPAAVRLMDRAGYR